LSDPAPGEQPGWRDRLLVALLGAVSAGLGRLPRERALRLGAGFGRMLARAGLRRDVMRRNLRVAFPTWSEAERERVAEQCIVNLSLAFVEICTLEKLDEAGLRDLVTIEGLEHLAAAQKHAPGHGVICLTGHYGNWEILGALMVAHGYPVSIVHRKRENPLLEVAAARWRKLGGAELLARGSAARGALRALRDGRFLAMPLDQDAPPSEAVFVPFFGRLASTRDGPARIAVRTGASVLPVFIRREGESGRHRVCVYPPVELLREGAETSVLALENTRRMTAALEQAIRDDPTQWTWTHRRWRTQPEGEAPPYPSKRRARPAA